ncbi:MAG: FAD:protein FMN transferase, partial [candidate division NC10 bacterium]|nr:FAD:protein FMN transferase [candidate division NC10 bacterium]
GGDVLAAGEGREGRGWRIGIQHPRRRDEFLGVLRLKDCFSLTSGDYERYFKIQGKRYHHILDPRSGYPASGCSTVTVLTPRLSRHYVPSVAVFLLGPEKGLSLVKGDPETAALIVTPEGKVITTPNLSSYLENPLPPQIDMTEDD